VSAGQFLAGHISAVKDFGVFVQFGRRFSALVPKSLLSDEVVADPHACPEAVVGNSVWVKVQSVDAASHRVLLNMKPSVVSTITGKTPAQAGKGAFRTSGEAVAEAASKPTSRKHAAGLPASALAVGTTVQAKVEMHVTSGDSDNAESLAVTLVGVTGRYKARLSLAECCDVCPFTGTVFNAEGLDTFKRLRENRDSSTGSPVFRAKVVLVHQSKTKKQKNDPDHTTDGVVSIELTVRQITFARPCFSFVTFLVTRPRALSDSPVRIEASRRSSVLPTLVTVQQAWLYFIRRHRRPAHPCHSLQPGWLHTWCLVLGRR
jgi:predicted RNA-binding protein with RPS1 domain